MHQVSILVFFICLSFFRYAFSKDPFVLGQVIRRAVSPQPEPWQPLSLSREIAVSVSIASSSSSSSSGGSSYTTDTVSFSDGDDIHATASDYCMQLLQEVSADVSQQDGLCKTHIVDLITDKLLRNRDIFSAAVPTTTTTDHHHHSEGFLIAPTELFKLLSSSKRVYNTATPFPHIALDGLFNLQLLNQCAGEFPRGSRRHPAAGWGQRLQYPDQFRKRYLNLEALMGPACRSVVSFLKSSVFVSFLEHLTGIRGLLTDPHNDGGGLHQTIAGGMLGVHTDFNYLKKLGLWRRVNVFLYLNAEPGWYHEEKGDTGTCSSSDSGSSSSSSSGSSSSSSSSSISSSDSSSIANSSSSSSSSTCGGGGRYTGGDLELWDSGAHRIVQSFAPIMNRLVIFTNSNVSLHGHPLSLEVPADSDISRKSIAMYFYSSRSGYDADPAHVTTRFRETGGYYRGRT